MQMEAIMDIKNKVVTVYNRYLFAVPVRGRIMGVSSHDGAYWINFFPGQHGNPDKRNSNDPSKGSYHFPQECIIEDIKPGESAYEGHAPGCASQGGMGLPEACNYGYTEEFRKKALAENMQMLEEIPENKRRLLYRKLHHAAHAELINTLDKSLHMLETKGHDYGIDNFTKAAQIASIMTGKEITATMIGAALVGIKIARYGELTSNNKTPKHEGVQDTVSDLINYCGLTERERQKELGMQE
jgi:hypothetical protein